jgi:hypothetical protein
MCVGGGGCARAGGGEREGGGVSVSLSLEWIIEFSLNLHYISTVLWVHSFIYDVYNNIFRQSDYMQLKE